MIHVQCDTVIPMFDWQHHRLLDGGFHQAADYLVYLIDKGCDVKVAFFLVRWTKQELVEDQMERFFMLHYGEYEKYKEHIVYLNNQDEYKITARLFLFVHAKFYTKIMERLVEYGRNVQDDIFGDANIIISKRYDAAAFHRLLDENKQYFDYKNKMFLMLPWYETDFHSDFFDDVVFHDFGINYKNYHTFANPDTETHMFNINYQKYTTVLKDKIDALIQQYNVLWFANRDDPRLQELEHYPLIVDDENIIYGMFNFYTHYHYMEPRWQTSNCRMIAETLHLGKELIWDRTVDFQDEALYKYNRGIYDKFYFDIDEVDVFKLLERMK